jgi:Bacterial membrane protein YfhO
MPAEFLSPETVQSPRAPAGQAKHFFPKSLKTKHFCILLVVLVGCLFPAVLTGRAVFVFRDYGLFSYPAAWFQRDCFWRGELPLWNPYNNCGTPFLAQWNTMALYPGSLLYLLLPLPWSLGLFSLLHLFWAGLGMFFLAQHWLSSAGDAESGQGVSRTNGLAAGVAGLGFAFNGLSLDFIMWPSHLATWAWLPWTIWLGYRAFQAGGRVLFVAAMAGAMQMLAGGPETIILTWLVIGLLAITECTLRPGAAVKVCVRIVVLVTLVAVLSAAQLLPFFELLKHSQRDSGFSANSHAWSMPPWGWANLLVPLFRTSPSASGVFMQNGQYWTSSYYPGAGMVLLGLIALRRSSGRHKWLLAVLIFLALTLAWGDVSFLYSGLRVALPGLGFVRYPIKFVILALALFPLLAAMGLKAVLEREQNSPPMKPRWKNCRFELLTLLALLLMIAGVCFVDHYSFTPDDVRAATLSNAFARAGFLIAIAGLLLLLVRSNGRGATVAGLLLLAVTWLDLATHVPNQNPTAKPHIYSADLTRRTMPQPWPSLGTGRVRTSPEAVEALAQNPLSNQSQNFLRNRLAGRVDCNILDHLPQVNGFYSLTPKEINDVTDALKTLPEPLLDFMGVTQTTAPGALTAWTNRSGAMPLVFSGQEPLYLDDQATFKAITLSNLNLKRYVILPLKAQAASEITAPTPARISDAVFGNNRVTFWADTPGNTWVSIAQSWSPGWKATVDSQPTRVWKANYAFEAVAVPAGRHQVKLEYWPDALKWGLCISAAGVLLVLGGLIHRPLASRCR